MEGKKSFLKYVGIFLLGVFLMTLTGCAVTNEAKLQTRSSEYKAAVGFGVKSENR